MDKIKQKTLNLSTNGDPLSEQTPLSSRGSARGSGGRQLERRGSFKGGFYQRSDRNSFDDQSFLSKPLSSARRRGSKNSVAIDVSDVSNFVDYDGGSGCCNMKLADLKLEKYTSSCFNSFEAGIIEARRVNKIKHTGRSIQSIRKKPSMSSMSIFSNAGKSLRAVTMITDNIMLGGKEDAENAALLMDYGVTHVLNTAQQVPNYFPQSFVYLKLSLLDAASTNLAEAQETAVSFLTHVENVNGRVLIHCLAGVSRSVTLLLMHLIVRHRIPLQNAFHYVRSCRPQINPNDSFKMQLARLEVQELRYSSVAKDAERIWDFYEWNSVKRSMPTSPPPDSTSAKKKAGFYSAEDLLLLEQQPQSGTGAGGISSNSGDSRERQLSITSQGDAGCCAIS